MTQKDDAKNHCLGRRAAGNGGGDGTQFPVAMPAESGRGETRWGHIALSFKPEDAPRLTDAFMARLAEEYLELMGIRNTQFIVVRHHGRDNPHCHIVFNRVDFDGKVISDSNDLRCNERVTKMLKDKYSLTYSEGKQAVKTEKLHASERVKYEIYRVVKEALRSASTWKEFQNKLLKNGRENGIQV